MKAIHTLYARAMLLAFAGVYLLGCASEPEIPEVSYYLLRSDAPLSSGEQSSPATLGIGRVVAAEYLNQAGIVVITEDNKVRPARQHLWAEPLEWSIRTFLRDEIASRVDYPISGDPSRRLYWRHRIDIDIDRLDGTLDGQVTLVASWILLDATSQVELASYRFERNASTSRDGYDALVATQTALLSDLAKAIADSLKTLPST